MPEVTKLANGAPSLSTPCGFYSKVIALNPQAISDATSFFIFCLTTLTSVCSQTHLTDTFIVKVMPEHMLAEKVLKTPFNVSNLTHVCRYLYTYVQV